MKEMKKEKRDSFFEYMRGTVGKSPIWKMLDIRRNSSRASPVFWFFFLSLIAIFAGFMIADLRFLIWFGGLAVLLLIMYIILWLKETLG